MARVFKSDLTVKGLRQLKKALREYQQVTLTENLKYMVDELCSIAKTTASVEVGSEWGAYVAFETEVQDTKYNYKIRGFMYGFNQSINIVTWIGEGGLPREAEVNSILMAEYGSGQFANPAYWRGTFPNQTHAFDDYWRWQTTDKVWHFSRGSKPTKPMSKAFLRVLTEYEAVATKALSR